MKRFQQAMQVAVVVDFFILEVTTKNYHAITRY